MSLDFGDLLVWAGLIVLGLAFLALEASILKRRSGARRWVALFAAMIAAWVVLDVVLDPAAHPLWPIDIILWLIPGVLVLLLVRGRREASGPN